MSFIRDLPYDLLFFINGFLFSEIKFNVYKVSKDKGSVSLLYYPDFFAASFPELSHSYYYDLKISKNDKALSFKKNPPILHRKELLLPPDHPDIPKFAALTRQLEEAGLFKDSRKIGYKKQWEERLFNAGYKVEDHKLLKLDGSEVNEKPPEKPSFITSNTSVERHKTALTRYALSKPVQTLAKFNFLEGQHTVFDYGCGKGSDVEILTKNEISAQGWDPHFCNDNPKLEAEIVNLGFVINVIEDTNERMEAVQGAYGLCTKFLCAAVMLGESSPDRGRLYRDGVLTSRNTFQKYFSQDEFRSYLRDVLGEEPVAVGPGIFFVFKDKDVEQAFLARRYRNRGSANRLINRIPKPTRAEKELAFYELHVPLLDALWSRWLELGRSPLEEEFNQASEVIALFSSWRRGLSFLQRFQGDEALRVAFDTRLQDLTVYFAMRRFDQSRVYGSLPDDLKRDVKAFFGSYQKARQAGERLLFSVGESNLIRETCLQTSQQGIGYLDDEGSLTFHTSLVESLPPILRVYIGCATLVFGDVTSADLIKVHADSGKLSLMMVDNFEGAALPLLLERVKINLAQQRFDYYKYGEQYASPYVYLKSRYITDDFTGFAEQQAFDEALLGLEGVDLDGYGMSREALDELLIKHRLQVDGLSLVRSQALPALDDACGQYHRFRDFIECGETQQRLGLSNLPLVADSYNALADLAREVVDPVMDYFGGIELTYGFCSHELSKHIKRRVDPSRDQHAAHEVNSRSNLICKRLGAACDFIVPDESMLEVAQWLVQNTPFDRLYFYGDDKPIHVSFGPEHSRSVVIMSLSKNNDRLIPRNISLDDFQSKFKLTFLN